MVSDSVFPNVAINGANCGPEPAVQLLHGFQRAAYSATPVQRGYADLAHNIQALEGTSRALIADLQVKRKELDASRKHLVSQIQAEQFLREELAFCRAENCRVLRQAAVLQPAFGPSYTIARNGSSDVATELELILMAALKPRRRDGCWFYPNSSSVAVLIEILWSASFCLILDSVADRGHHWMVFASFHGALFVAMVLQSSHVRLHWNVTASHEEPESGESEGTSETERLLARKCGAEDLVDRKIEPVEQLLNVHRHACAAGFLMACSHILYLALFAVSFPAMCTWNRARISGATGEGEILEPIRGGTLTCSAIYDSTLLFTTDSAGASIALVFLLPIIWTFAWMSQHRATAAAAADDLVEWTRLNFNVCSKDFGGDNELSVRVRERLIAMAQDIEWRRMDGVRTAFNLFFDVADCLELWATVVSSGQLLLPSVINASTLPHVHKMFLLDTNRETISLAATVWLGAIGIWIPLLTLLGFVVWHHLQLMRHGCKVTILPENAHYVYLLFMRNEISAPSRNWCIAVNAALAVLFLDCPLFCLRLMLAGSVQASLSFFVVKGPIFVAMRLRILIKYLIWIGKARDLRQKHHLSTKALHSRILDLSGVSSNTWGATENSAADLQGQFEDTFKVLGVPRNEFIRLYTADIGGIFDAPAIPNAPTSECTDGDDDFTS